MATQAQPPKELLKEVEKGTELKKSHIVHDASQESIARAKIESAVLSGKAAENLKKHVETKGEGVSDAVKEAFKEDRKEKSH